MNDEGSASDEAAVNHEGSAGDEAVINDHGAMDDEAAINDDGAIEEDAPATEQSAGNETSTRPGRARGVSRHPRRRSLLIVATALIALVLLNVFVRQKSVDALARFRAPPSLPVVQMTKPSAWRCPGPLPVGSGPEHSHVSIANGSSSAVGVMVTVARVGLPSSKGTRTSSASTTRLEVRGGSQTIFPLPDTGPPGFAAVSVDTEEGGIAVAESIAGHQTIGGPVALSSPCSMGAGTHGYVASGSTYGGSDVRLGLYNPDASPAVVDVEVSTGTSLTAPPAFQGVTVPPTGIVVLDIRRWVPQSISLALSATAVSGAIVVGALESTATSFVVRTGAGSPHRFRRFLVTGSSLLVGPESGLPLWSFGAATQRGTSSTFSAYNPGTRPVTASIAPPGRAGAAAALTAEIPAGGVVEFPTPVPSRGGRPGSVVVSARGGAAIVVVRLTTSTVGHRAVEALDVTSGTAGPSTEWLLPAGAASPKFGDVVVLTNPGARAANVTLRALRNEDLAPVDMSSVGLPAGARVAIELAPALKDAPAFALQVSATAPVLAEQLLTPLHGLTTSVGGVPVRR